VKHFHEHLQLSHGRPWSYSWVKTKLQAADLVPRLRCRGSPHRRKRERKPCEGMMPHQDGSRAAWLAGRPALDLVVTMDDATSTLYSALLVEEEGTASTFRGLLKCSTPRVCREALQPDFVAFIQRAPHLPQHDLRDRVDALQDQFVVCIGRTKLALVLRAERHNLVTIRIVGPRDKLSIWDRPTQTQDETGGWFSVAS